VVVVGAEAELVEEAVGRAAQVVHNPEWGQGQSTSVKRGLAAVTGSVEAAIFLLADMPLVSADLVAGLVAEHRSTLAPIVAPRSRGRWGNPVLFDYATFADLAGVTGDQGGRALFGRYDVHPLESDDRSLRDIDEPGDWSDLEVTTDPSD
jgi:molybdenum cofactor cytidylyltransferase